MQAMYILGQYNLGNVDAALIILLVKSFHYLNGVTEGSSQMNTWPAEQMSPDPLGGV